MRVVLEIGFFKDGMGLFKDCSVPVVSSGDGELRGPAPALSNTPASASQQAAQPRPRAAPPAECQSCKINIGS